MRVIIIILIVVLLAYSAYKYVSRGFDKLSFNVYFKSADLSGITLANLVTSVIGGVKNINVVIGADVKNDNNYAITFSGLKAKLAYNRVVFAETSGDLASKKFTVQPNSTLSIEDKTTFTLNKSSLSILKEKISGGNPKIDYSISVKVYGISLPVFNGNFNW